MFEDQDNYDLHLERDWDQGYDYDDRDEYYPDPDAHYDDRYEIDF